MRVKQSRVLMVFVCLAFALGSLGLSSPAAAADKKKSWPSKKHHKSHHKSSKPAGKATKAGSAAPADDADEEDGDESAEADDKAEAPKAKAKSSQASSESSDGERETASDDKSGGDDDDSSVVRRKAKSPATDTTGAPVAFELSAGPRAIHRTFDFNDPLPSLPKPYSYRLPAGPTPFVDLALYPAAFATRGFAASFGVIARYEKLLGTKTTAPDGSSFSTLGQQFEVGLRGRVPLGEHEVGLTASYGKHTFHVSETDNGPGAGSTLPNVDYTFAGIDADARVRLSPIELGAHVGTRLVLDTGALGTKWFSTVKTTSIEAGVSAAYRLTPLFSVVAGADFLRYAFDFNPVRPGPVVAGGAVDQYISGFLALRVSLAGI